MPRLIISIISGLVWCTFLATGAVIAGLILGIAYSAFKIGSTVLTG
jgi:hypothetical protein